jgi:hypothetical protein
MHGLPKDFDGSFFLGRILEMVCFNQNQIYLHFDDKITVAIESAFSYKDVQVMSVPVQKSNLMELLGASVSRVQTGRDGTLELLFDNGSELKIYDTTPQYESYSITYEGHVIIV